MADIIVKTLILNDEREVVSSGTSIINALENIVKAINNGAICKNDHLNIVYLPNSKKVNVIFDSEIYYLKNMAGSIIVTFTEYPELVDFCADHQLNIIKERGI